MNLTERNVPFMSSTIVGRKRMLGNKKDILSVVVGNFHKDSGEHITE